MPVLCQEYMLFFCLPLSNQPRLDTQQQGRAPPVWRPSPPPPARAPVVVLSLGWLLNGKQKNSIYSRQRTGICFWPNSWKYVSSMYPPVPTSWGHAKKDGTKSLNMFCTHVTTNCVGHVKTYETKFPKKNRPCIFYPIWFVSPSRITISQNIQYYDISDDLNCGQ